MAGWYCPEGSDSRVKVICPIGHYCLEGSISPTPCPIATYNPAEGLNTTDCLICTAGKGSMCAHALSHASYQRAEFGHQPDLSMSSEPGHSNQAMTLPTIAVTVTVTLPTVAVTVWFDLVLVIGTVNSW